MQTAVRPIFNRDVISALYESPEFQVIAHDHRGAYPVFHPRARYLGAYVGDKIAGLFLVIEASEIEVDLHALILRRFIRYSRALGRACISYVFRDSAIQRATAYVVEGCESVINYTKKLGFAHEGMRRNACSVGGQLRGVHIMGITRQEAEAWDS